MGQSSGMLRSRSRVLELPKGLELSAGRLVHVGNLGLKSENPGMLHQIQVALKLVQKRI